MSAALREREEITVEDYLEGELASEVRHEFLGGLVYAMAGASEAHNVISGNIFLALGQHLRGKPCRAFINDMKAHAVVQNMDMFYYPDVMVACGPIEGSRYYRDDPVLIVEVLSPTTERIDRREKPHSYMAIPTMKAYVLVAQDRMEVTVFRRVDESGWRETEVLRAPDDMLAFEFLDFQTPLARIYEDVRL